MILKLLQQLSRKFSNDQKNSSTVKKETTSFLVNLAPKKKKGSTSKKETTFL